jgi:serine phosphatase RsbU (regulator of sigma subunit)
MFWCCTRTASQERRGLGGEEFGEFRLLQTLRTGSRLPVAVLQQRIVEAVQKFAFGEQHDDITLVVARCKEAALTGNGRISEI